MTALDWDIARDNTYAAAANAALYPLHCKISEADGTTLAAPLTALTPMPPFTTSSVDGYAVRGSGPWTLSGRVLAGEIAPSIADGCAVEVATGAMVPAELDNIIRTENATIEGDKVHGQTRPKKEWREVGEEFASGDLLVSQGVPITPAVIGVAAACGYDTIEVRPKPRAAVLVFGDELASSGVPENGQIRDSLGPLLPSLLRGVGATIAPGFSPRGPIEDTLEAHVSGLRAALDDADIVCTTGGTMHGPVDYLHEALKELGAEYVVNTVTVRPAFPMLLASLPGGRFVVGLPGNPQSAVVAVMTLVLPLLAGLSGRALGTMPRVRLAADIPGRGSDTHLALVSVDVDGNAHPVSHVGSSMLRGLAASDGFAVIEANTDGSAGDMVRYLPLPVPGGAG